MAHITISDVARLAGVSTATVSRVLDHSPKVSEPTRERVLSVARSLGYKPSAIARSLSTGHTHTIGLIVTNVSNPYYPEMVAGIEDEAREAGYSTLLCNSYDDQERERAYLDLLVERRIDGVVIASSGLTQRNPQLPAHLPIPMVLANADGKSLGLPSVSSDNYAGARALTEYILRLGHTRIAYIAGPGGLQTAGQRLLGFREALKAAQLDPASYAVIKSRSDATGGETAMEHILLLDPRPTAVLAYNDLTAIGAMHTCHRAGLQVPDDISIAGFDDIQLSRLVYPPLTTVAQSTSLMGKLAVRQLLDILSGRSEGENILLPCHLVERESCGPAVSEVIERTVR